MTKKELLDYIEHLINNLKIEQLNITENQLGDLVYLQKKVDRVLSDVKYLNEINLETLDKYIKVPFDILNIVAFYQQLSASSYYPLDESQKKYIIYLFNAFKTILENKKNDFKENSLEYQELDSQINKLNDVRTILISKIYITLDDFILMIPIIEKMKTNYSEDLLYNISLYMQNVMKKSDNLGEKSQGSK